MVASATRGLVQAAASPLTEVDVETEVGDLSKMTLTERKVCPCFVGVLEKQL